MPRKRWIDKNKAQNFQLLYRSQNDPLAYDDAAGERALFEVGGGESSSRQSNSDKGLHLADLEDDLDFENMRENEGEAAQHGIFFDDTNYDYMQHLRDVDETEEDIPYFNAVNLKTQAKGKGNAKVMKLEDALREASLHDDHSTSYDEVRSSFGGSSDIFGLKAGRGYQTQQNIPDEIAGFQPDMDPRLREVLEALEDDAFVDEDDQDDIFGALGKDGRNGELELSEFQANLDDDEGWESDATEKMPTPKLQPQMPSMNSTDENDVDQATRLETAVAEDGNWLRDFAKYKREAMKKPVKATDSIVAPSSTQDKQPSLYTLNGSPLRRKKRKGALTNPSAYSMTSSSLARTEGQQLLDARFDQVEKMYSLDEADEYEDADGGMSLISDMTGKSKMSQISTSSFADKKALRGDFDNLVDGFLDDWDQTHPGGAKGRGAKGRRSRNGNLELGSKYLDDLRSDLGPARLNQRA